MKVTATDDLTSVGFKVCTALDRAGVTSVLTGGSAATVYAPDAYQSADLDFIVELGAEPAASEAALIALGYREDRGCYRHDQNPLVLEFPPGPIKIGDRFVHTWDTLSQGELLLHILTPTNCCMDRLAHYAHWDDRSALAQAVAVARRQGVDLGEVRDWLAEEGRREAFREFQRELDRRA